MPNDPPAAAAPADARVAVRIWDLPTRLFHWALAILVAIAWISGQQGAMALHLLAGYCVLALVLSRLLWGVMGSESARFATFLRGPRAAFTHLGELLRWRPDHDTTHNPMGGYAVALLLIALLVQAGSGLFADDEILAMGPLSGYMPGAVVRFATWLHVLNQNIVLALVLLHLLAVLAYALLFRRDLVRPMVTGIKQLPQGTAAPRMRSLWLAVALFLLCAAAVQGIASLGG